MERPGVPFAELLAQQARWLAPARSRLLRRAAIARRRRVLDLGCGCGAVAEELARCSGGRVVGVDCSRTAITGTVPLLASTKMGLSPLSASRNSSLRLRRTVAVSQRLVRHGVLPVRSAVDERPRRPCAKSAAPLIPGGVLAALEPDYGGMIEHPPQIATRDLWLAALQRADADPYVGRKLPKLLAAAGLRVDVALLDRLQPPSPLRFDLLAGLPLTQDENAALQRIRRADAELNDADRVAHLPMFLILAEVPGQ